MDKSIQNLDNVVPGRNADAWRFVVRVIRLWEVPLFTSIEMVLIDQNGVKIHATIPKQLMYLFQHKLIEGKVYKLSNFTVLLNSGAYRTTHHTYKLIFQMKTKVKESHDYEISLIPNHGLTLTDISQITSRTQDYEYLVDVIGLMTGISAEREFVRDGKLTKILVIELTDQSGKCECTLFGNYVDELHKLMGKAVEGSPVIVIQFAKVKIFRGKASIQNVVGSTTRIYLNPSFPEALKFKEGKEVWFTFPKQNEAIKFAKRQEDVHLFCYQDHLNGYRRFLVTTYTEFWQRYKTMDSKTRHFYEVIQEGLPCHLYFDLEFNRKVNVGKNGDEMVDLLISTVLEALHEMYEILGHQDWIVELDSSTEDKFSRHLIIRIPKAAFKDNSHAGAFVSEICSRILNARGKDKSYEKLFIAKDSITNESVGQLFVDNAVYSRNRCFRLHLSSKAEKTSILLPTERFKCKNLSEEDIFMASLICNMDVDCGELLVGKPDSDCVKTLHFDTKLNCNVGNSVQSHPEFTVNTCTSDVSTTYYKGKSPFPSLDEFILSVASVGNIPGKIHSWYLYSESGFMVYNMTKNRYCERIGRHHKSNNVMYVVDLRRQVYYQKCHDPDCKGYRSCSRPIPVHVFSNSSIGSSGMLDYKQPVEDEQGHQPDDNKPNLEC